VRRLSHRRQPNELCEGNTEPMGSVILAS